MGKSNFDTIKELQAEIRRRRKDKKILIDAFADFAGISVNTLRNVERGKDCYISTLAAICDASGIKLRYE